MSGLKASNKIFCLLVVSRTLVQTSTPTAIKTRRKITKHSAQRSWCRTALSPVMLWCLLTLFWGAASTTCVNTMACSQHSATTLTRTLRPVRARESALAGGTAPSAVSQTRNAWISTMFKGYSPQVLRFLAFSTAIPCPPNSHYSECTPPCPPTCSDLFPIFCHLPSTTCVEGCQCDAGHVLSDDKCVPLDQCGCLDSDREYHDVSVRSRNEYDGAVGWWAWTGCHGASTASTASILIHIYSSAAQHLWSDLLYSSIYLVMIKLQK